MARDSDAGNIHNEGHIFWGEGPDIETFLGPKMAASEASAIWAQSKERFRNQQRHIKYIINASVT